MQQYEVCFWDAEEALSSFWEAKQCRFDKTGDRCLKLSALETDFSVSGVSQHSYELMTVLPLVVPSLQKSHSRFACRAKLREHESIDGIFSGTTLLKEQPQGSPLISLKGKSLRPWSLSGRMFKEASSLAFWSRLLAC